MTSGLAPAPARAAPPRLLPLPPAWPLTGVLLLYPLWWVLGLGVLIFPIAAVPMVVILARQHLAGRSLRTPPGFLLWLVFLAVVVLGVAALDATPAGTVAGTPTDRLAGAGYRIVGYGSLTVLLLYAGNLREWELSQRRLVRLLAWLFAVTVVGGLVGTLAGHASLTSPAELLLPVELRGNGFVQSLVHPYAAQLMDVGTGTVARPAAPWGYTNTWGNNVLLLVGWFLVWAVTARRPGRLVAGLVLVVALVPVVHSLNRGLWVGLVVLAGFAAVRLAWRPARSVTGRLTPLVAIAGVAIVLAGTLAVTPLGDTVTQRLEHGHSDGVRAFLTQRAVEGVAESPVIGFGSTRSTQGGRHSIAIGPTPECARCGSFTVGGNGQLWQLLFAHGLVGTAAYLGFFGFGLWRFRRDHSPVGIAGSAALAGSFASMLWYNALVTPLALLLLSYVLLWRQHTPERPGATMSPLATAPAALLPRAQAGATMSPLATAPPELPWRQNPPEGR